MTVVVAAAVAEYTRDSGTWQNAEKLHVIRMVPGKKVNYQFGFFEK